MIEVETAYPVYVNRRTGKQFLGFPTATPDARAWCKAWLSELRHNKRTATVRPVYLVRVRPK